MSRLLWVIPWHLPNSWGKNTEEPQLGYHNTQITIPIIKTRNKRHLSYNNNIYLSEIGFSPGGSGFKHILESSEPSQHLLSRQRETCILKFRDNVSVIVGHCTHTHISSSCSKCPPPFATHFSARINSDWMVEAILSDSFVFVLPLRKSERAILL